MSGINDWEPMAHVLRFCDGEKRVIEVLQFTRSFKVFKVMFNHRGGDHLLAPEVEVENIGDEALFLGYKSTTIQSLFWLQKFPGVSQIPYTIPMILLRVSSI